MKGFKFEPQATAESIRLIMAAFIVFGILPWTPEQEVVAFAAISGVMTWITRSWSIPVQTVEDAGTSVIKLQSAAEDKEARKAGELPPRAPGALVALLVAGSMVLTGCADNNKPNLTPAGRVADNASEVIRMADLALTGIDIATPTVIPAATTVKIARAFKEVGKGGLTLADALEAYKRNVSAESWKSLHSALTAVNGLVADAIALAPEGPARDKVKLLAEPIFAALFAIVLPPPPASTTLGDLEKYREWQEERHLFLIASEVITQ